jgi:hypothetical protein
MARILIILAAIAMIAGGWSYVWFRGAAEISARSDSLAEQLRLAGDRLECANRRIEGFPFRIGIHCDQIAFAPSEGGSFEAKAVRSAAQFYDPGHIVGELDGPALLQLPDGRRFELQWENLRTSLRLGFSGLNALSFELRQPSLAVQSAGSASPSIARSNVIEFHARKSPSSDENLDLALRLADASDPAGRVPGLSLDADLTLEAIAGKLGGDFDPIADIRENGLSGNARSIVLTPSGGGRLVLSGPFSISTTGLVSGEIRLEATDLAKLGAFFAQLVPERRELVGNVVSLLSAIVPESGTKSNDQPTALTLKIRDGAMSIGLIPVAELPPVF